MGDVVSIFDKKKESTETKKEKDDQEPTFEEVMERNRKNKEREEKERASANKGVLRSYRIKN